MHRLRFESSLHSSDGKGYLRRRYIPLSKLTALRVEDPSSLYPMDYPSTAPFMLKKA